MFRLFLFSQVSLAASREFSFEHLMFLMLLEFLLYVAVCCKKTFNTHTHMVDKEYYIKFPQTHTNLIFCQSYLLDIITFFAFVIFTFHNIFLHVEPNQPNYHTLYSSGSIEFISTFQSIFFSTMLYLFLSTHNFF